MTSFHTCAFTIKRPMVTMRTALKDLPVKFMQEVLPRLSIHGFAPCWIWMGAINDHGYPVVHDRGRRKFLRPRVARMFWDFPEDGVVRMTCPNVNCLNPNHMVLCGPLWKKGEFNVQIPRS